MNLVIDEGNSSIKAAIFHDGKLMKTFKGTTDLFQEFITSSAFDQQLYCTVQNSSVIPSILPSCVKLTYQTILPFKINYDTPKTLGMDRIAAIAGSEMLKPSQNNLVIDIGTCITYDLLIDNQFIGGIISPGIQLRNSSMHNYTSSLPLINHRQINWPTLIGKTTIDAMLSGIFQGTASEINGFVDQIKKSYRIENIFLTGGDANFFESKIKEPIFVDPELVLRGLNSILLYTNDQ